MNKRAQAALWAVFAATAAVRIGFGGILPVLPLYAQQHGMNTLLIAVMTNAFMLSNALCQNYTGTLGDRWGRRPVLLAGLALYTLAACLFMLDAGPWYYIALRAVEGLGASAFGPTVRAFVADLVPERERGQAFAQLSACDMAGFLFGPVFGGVAQGLLGPRAPFGLFALLGLLAMLPLLLFARAAAADGAVQRPAARLQTRRVLLSAGFWAVALPSVGFAYLVGLYNIIWSLYMQRAGASPWQISLSFTIWALPMVILSVPAGRLADRYGRPLIMALGGALSVLVTPLYAYLASPVPLLILSGVDGVGNACFIPANQAYMAEVAPAQTRGRFFGLVGSLSTSATILASFAVGYLYERIAAFWLFGLGALILAGTVGGAIYLMVHRPAAQMQAHLSALQVAGD